MSKVTLKVEIDEEAYKQIKGDSVCSNNNECIISKSSSAYYALNAIINATTLTECDDTVSRGVFEQVMWERDTAIEQLRKLGYELGQKIEPCEDCVSRQALLDFFKDDDYVVNEINNMPSVIPKHNPNNNIKTHYFHNDDYCPKESEE